MYFFSCWKHSHSRTSGDADKLMLLLWIILFVLQYSCTSHAHLSLWFISSFFFFFFFSLTIVKIALQTFSVKMPAAIHLVELTYVERHCTGWIYVFKSITQTGERDFYLKFRELSIWIKCSANVTLFLWERKFFSYFAHHLFLVDPRIILKLCQGDYCYCLWNSHCAIQSLY